MKYRFLGSSGLLISRITLGTMTFGAPEWGCDEKEGHGDRGDLQNAVRNGATTTPKGSQKSRP